MTGTAAEVTPIRSVDDQRDRRPGPGHEGDPGDLPRRRSRAASTGTRTGSSTFRSRRRSREASPGGRDSPGRVAERPDPAVPALRRRARGGARARGASLRTARARPDDRPVRAGAGRAGRRAVRRRRLERHRRASSLRSAGRARPGRRGDHLAVLLRRVAPTASSTRARRRSSPTSIRGRSTSTRPRSRRPSRRGRRRSSPSTSSATRASSTSCGDSPTRHGLALIEDACEALGAEYRGRRSAPSATRPSSPSIPNKQVTTGEGGAVAVQTEEEWRLLKSLANQGRADSGGWLEHARFGYNYRLDDLVGGRRPRAGRAARRDPRAALGGGCALRRACSRGSTASRRSSPTTPTTGARGSSIPVRLAPGIDRERVIARARRARHRHEPLPARRSTCSRTCASGSASAKACCRSPRRRAAALLALPFFTELSAADQEASRWSAAIGSTGRRLR